MVTVYKCYQLHTHARIFFNEIFLSLVNFFLFDKNPNKSIRDNFKYHYRKYV